MLFVLFRDSFCCCCLQSFAVFWGFNFLGFGSYFVCYGKICKVSFWRDLAFFRMHSFFNVTSYCLSHSFLGLVLCYGAVGLRLLNLYSVCPFLGNETVWRLSIFVSSLWLLMWFWVNLFCWHGIFSTFHQCFSGDLVSFSFAVCFLVWFAYCI